MPRFSTQLAKDIIAGERIVILFDLKQDIFLEYQQILIYRYTHLTFFTIIDKNKWKVLLTHLAILLK